MENYEIEIKIPVAEPEAVEKRLLAQGFRKTGCIREEDMYYNSTHHDVREHDEALRIRKSTDLLTGRERAQVNFKGKKIDRASMSRSEYETEIGSPDQMEKILSGIGFEPVAGVCKVRQYLTRGKMTACLDQVENLGDFLELEMLAEDRFLCKKYLDIMQALLEKLGLSMADTVRVSYLGMIMEKKGLL